MLELEYAWTKQLPTLYPAINHQYELARHQVGIVVGSITRARLATYIGSGSQVYGPVKADADRCVVSSTTGLQLHLQQLPNPSY